jgi:hypothetical protein
LCDDSGEEFKQMLTCDDAGKLRSNLPISELLLSHSREFARVCVVILASFLFYACSLQPNIPIIVDDRVEQLVQADAMQILAVSPDRENLLSYRILLSAFPRSDILGMSIGQRRIYISYELGRRALRNSRYRWLLRQTLAHEIAHEIAGHAGQMQASFNRAAMARSITASDIGLPRYVNVQSYSLEKELQADLEGMSYWSKLHWDCAIWVRIFEEFEKRNYPGDALHPTDARLQQASRACLPAAGFERNSAQANSPAPESNRP